MSAQDPARKNKKKTYLYIHATEKQNKYNNGD